MLLIPVVLSDQGQLTLITARNPDSQTTELDREYLDTVTVQGREYQKYSIDHHTYFGPVDEVRRSDFHGCLLTDSRARKKHNDSKTSNNFSKEFSTIV